MQELFKSAFCNLSVCAARLWNRTKEAVQGFAQKAGGVWSVVLGALGDVFGAMIAQVQQLNWSAIWGAIKTGIAKMLNPWGTIKEAIGGIIEDVKEAVKSLATFSFDSAQAALEKAEATAKRALSIGQKGITLVESVGGYVYLLTLALPTILGSIFPAAGNAAGAAIGQTINDVMSAILQGVSTGINTVLTAFGFKDLYTLASKKEAELGDKYDPETDNLYETFNEGEKQQAQGATTQIVANGVQVAIGWVMSLLGTAAVTVGKNVWAKINKVIDLDGFFAKAVKKGKMLLKKAGIGAEHAEEALAKNKQQLAKARQRGEEAPKTETFGDDHHNETRQGPDGRPEIVTCSVASECALLLRKTKGVKNADARKELEDLQAKIKAKSLTKDQAREELEKIANKYPDEKALVEFRPTPREDLAAIEAFENEGGATAPATRPTAGETEATAIGKDVHKAIADARRASGDFELVQSPITDKAGNPILVSKKVNLATGMPVPGSPVQTAVPDAVSFKYDVIIDDKPLGRSIAKDRQEMIRNIKAFQQAEGRLPRVIGITRYDPKTGQVLLTELYSPDDFLP